MELGFSPEGKIFPYKEDSIEISSPANDFFELEDLFKKDFPLALVRLGLSDFKTELSPSVFFWQSFARLFIASVCKLQSIASMPLPSVSDLESLLAGAPFMRGSEYISLPFLLEFWARMREALRADTRVFQGSLQEYFNQYGGRWSLAGFVCFHLAENKSHPTKPFAFLATYTTAPSEDPAAQHLPLKRAIQNSTPAQLLNLLAPVQKAAALSPFVQRIVDSGALFEAVAWTAREAHQFLQEIPLMEGSGVVIRVPNWWSAKKPARLKAQVQIGDTAPSMLGLDSLLTFDIRLAHPDGDSLSLEEWEALARGGEKFVKLRGNWVEIDAEKLGELLSQWNRLKRSAKEGLSMAEALRLLAGGPSAGLGESKAESVCSEWLQVLPGSWLQEAISQLKNPEAKGVEVVEEVLAQSLQATLRPYQRRGVQWLWTLYQLRLGGCLADDMGLGKTIQVLSLLLTIKALRGVGLPHLLVVPASLLGNWQAESHRFAPTLSVRLIVSGAREDNCSEGVDLFITTYGNLYRSEWMQTKEWDLVVLDEAQAIKNPGAKQTMAAKSLRSQMRLALTGTPVENRLGDLWSLFDFTSPGLLGSAKAFSSLLKSADASRFIAALRKLTQPYILRRMKTDRTIIADLPDKTEMKTYCHLSDSQIRLYQETTEDLILQLEKAEGMKRRGLVLASLMRLKQICNHPVQWLGVGEYEEGASGKWARLREICEAICEKQEKVLIFTQFKEIIAPLFAFLTKIFGQEGLMLHGGTAVSQRALLVEKFQTDPGCPFFLLSLKAGGTGLNLTRASHVIHFDRWWNPAVENQATDRAYRIGQKRSVLVHQFVCRGTIEEKIDLLIESKKNLSKELLEGSGEILFTELSNDQVIDLVSLDLSRALGE